MGYDCLLKINTQGFENGKNKKLKGQDSFGRKNGLLQN